MRIIRRLLRNWVLLLWALGIVLLSTQAATVESHLAEPNFAIGGHESATALDLEKKHFGSAIEFPILLEGPRKESVATARQIVRNFHWIEGGSAFFKGYEHGAVMVIGIVGRPESEALTAAREVRDLVREVAAPPTEAHITGEATITLGLQEATVDELRKGELIALPVLLLVLLLVFRSVVAALIPIAFGAITVVSGFGLVSVLARVIHLDVLALSLASMIGLAIGVDYSLLMVSRFREELQSGTSPAEAGRATARMGGRTVILAGVVLLIAMATAAALSPGSFITATTIGVAAVTATGALSARIAIPPLLVALGPRIDALSLRRVGPPARKTRLVRILEASLRHPLRVAGPITVLLLLPLLPALELDPKTPGPTILPAGSEARQDFERFESVMGPGWAAPFVVVFESPRRSLLSSGRLIEVGRFQQDLERSPQVEEVIGPAIILEATDPAWEAETRLQEQTLLVDDGLRSLADVKGSILEATSLANRLQQGLSRAHAQGPGPLAPSSSQDRFDQASSRTVRRLVGELQASAGTARRLAGQGEEIATGTRQLVSATSLFGYVIPALREGKYGIKYKDEGKRAEIALQGIERAHARARTLGEGARRLQARARRLSEKGRRLEAALATAKESGDLTERQAEELSGGLTGIALLLSENTRRFEGIRPPLALAELQLGMSANLVENLTSTNIHRADEELKGAKRAQLNRVLNIDAGGNAARLLVVGNSTPGSEASTRFSALLRERASGFSAGTGIETAVGGQGQLLLDVGDAVRSRLPLLLIGLSIVTWIVLAIALRALLAPLVAVILNVLTVGFAFGILVLLYQGDSPLLGGPGYLSVIAALSILGVTFGLSIDYEVFLLSRLREEWVRTQDAEAAIFDAVRSTSRVITGAALVMVGVFLSFCITGYPANQQLGVGLTIAILLDATLVRLVILPSLLKLCGPWAWWAPAFLRGTSLEPPRQPRPADTPGG